MERHHLTQPLPTRLAPRAHRASNATKRCARLQSWGTLALELGAPWLLLCAPPLCDVGVVLQALALLCVIVPFIA
jgi:hypothetical protein